MARQSVANLTPEQVTEVVAAIKAGDTKYVRDYEGVGYVGMREFTYLSHLHYSTVRNYVVNGTLPSIKIGRLYLIDYKKSLDLIFSGKLADISANPYEK